MQVERAHERLTIEDWLSFEGEGDTRYELIDGVIVAMNPPKPWHGTIATITGARVREKLGGRFPGRVLQPAAVAVGPYDGLLPDVTLSCEPFDRNEARIREPRLVVEIVPDETDRYDQTNKLARCQRWRREGHEHPPRHRSHRLEQRRSAGARRRHSARTMPRRGAPRRLRRSGERREISG